MGRDATARAKDASADERRRAVDSDPPELVDVPAAVVCANCGDPDCPGCSQMDELTQGSGVVAIVPWERPGHGLLARLWNTARLSTRAYNSFFGALPDGDIASALRFALIAELLAVSSVVLAFVPVVLLIAPWLIHAVVHDPELRRGFARALIAGVPIVAIAMVALHTLHGIGLDIGARRQGAPKRRGRGLRFGFYACGWDLVTLPLGLLIVALSEGPRAALGTAPLGMTVPARAAASYLRGVHHLDEERAREAGRFASTVTALAVGTMGILAFAGLVIYALAGG